MQFANIVKILQICKKWNIKEVSLKLLFYFDSVYFQITSVPDANVIKHTAVKSGNLPLF